MKGLIEFRNDDITKNDFAEIMGIKFFNCLEQAISKNHSHKKKSGSLEY